MEAVVRQPFGNIINADFGGCRNVAQVRDALMGHRTVKPEYSTG